MKLNTLWNEEYRPGTFKELIIPKRIKKVLTGYTRKKDVPNLLFYGTAGTCKTTTAKVIIKELDAEHLFINGSDENGKADILNQVLPFATGISSYNPDTPKIVFIDESDRLTKNAQDAIKTYMEEYSGNCRFIFTANTPSMIIKPIHSRCVCFNFDIDSSEKPELMLALLNRLEYILLQKGIQYNKKVLQALIVSRFPDYRAIINSIQAYATGHECIDEGILSLNNTDISATLYEYIKTKDFDGLRKWLYETNYSQEEMFRALFRGMGTHLVSKSIPAAVVILADYQAKADRAIIPQVNILACIVELMNECVPV